MLRRLKPSFSARLRKVRRVRWRCWSSYASAPGSWYFAFENAIDEYGEFARGGGDGFGFAHTEGESTVVSAERGIHTPHVNGRHAQ